eukprot:COSAG06_NODE_5277_length_3590_cov_19.689487_3_plen_451_part_00
MRSTRGRQSRYARPAARGAPSSLRLDAGGMDVSASDPLGLLLPGVRPTARGGGAEAPPAPDPDVPDAPDVSAPALISELKAQLAAAVAAEDYGTVAKLGAALSELQERARAGEVKPPDSAAELMLAARRMRPQLKLRYGFDAAMHRGTPKAFPVELVPKFVEVRFSPRAVQPSSGQPCPAHPSIVRAESACPCVREQLGVDQKTLDFMKGPKPSEQAAAAADHGAVDGPMTNTDRIALLDTHLMHVMSSEQAQVMFGAERLGGKLLDIGAGVGAVTEELAVLFDDALTTEVSQNMAERLRERGFDCMHTRGTGDLAEEFRAHCGGTIPELRAISLLNVLDRCPEPQTMLESIYRMMVPGHTQLLIALVLPFGPFVETPHGRVAPTEKLPISPNCCWETAVASLLANVLTPMGFEVERVGRVPYLDQCPQCGIFELDDVLLVLRRPSEAAQ